MEKFDRRKFLYLGLCTVAGIACENTPLKEQRFTLENNEVKSYRKKLYLYNDYPASRLSISSTLIEGLFTNPNGIQIPDDAAIAVLFAKARPSVQQMNNYLIEFSNVWKNNLMRDLGQVPAKREIIILLPEDFIIYGEKTKISQQTHKNLSLAFVVKLKEISDSLSNKQIQTLNPYLENVVKLEPVRIELK